MMRLRHAENDTVVLSTHKVCVHTNIIEAAGVWLLLVQTYTHVHMHILTLCVHTYVLYVHRKVFSNNNFSKFCEQTAFANIFARQTLHCIENKVILLADYDEIYTCVLMEDLFLGSNNSSVL